MLHLIHVTYQYVSFITVVKAVYKCQPYELQKWPLFRTSETTFRFSWDELKLAFVDRKPLLAGVLM